jgi:hypothetical protein
MPKGSKDKWFETYKDSRVQLFISKFLSGEITAVSPIYDLEQGYRYPIVEDITGDRAGATEFLENLAELGILRRKLYDKTLHCSNCGSANVSIRYCCPYCSSFDVSKSSLIEHIRCGYIDTEEHFREADKLMCPRCHVELTKPDMDYRKAGVWCTCNECGKSFDIPITSHFCRNCHHNFGFEEAIYKDVYSYSMTEEAMQEASLGWILIAPIREFLQSRGFQVESPGFLKGKSGANHMFDIIAYRSGNSENANAFDLATSTGDAVSEQAVIAMFAKVFDATPNRACLIAIPKLNNNAKKLAVLYKIDLIEAKGQDEAIDALEACLR